MKSVELSDWIRNWYPANAASLSLRRKLYDVGVNDADYVTSPRIDGKQLVCPAVSCWRGLIERAYCEKLHAGHPTYKDVTVCDDWHYFMNFRRWWCENVIDGYALDKDLLVPGNKEYSPNACVFVPQWLNSFTTDKGRDRGLYPIGCYSVKGRFMSRCSNPVSLKREFLGYFDSPDDASDAWRKRKLQIAAEIKHIIDEIDTRIYQGLVEKICSAA